MKRTFFPLLLACLLPLAVAAQEVTGLTVLKSSHDVATTTDKLIAAVEAKGLKIFARIDHAAGAEKAGLTLAPTELVLFGDPKLGTTLMHCSHTIAIDLPLKALVWQDPDGAVWLGYNAPDYLAERHGIEGCGKPLAKVSGALAKFAAAATE